MWNLTHIFHLGTQCQTIDNYNCKFPFKYNGHTYWTCSDEARNDVPNGLRWCATDSNEEGHFKSVGVCKSNCQESKYRAFYHCDDFYYLNVHFYKNILLVCRLPSNKTCNVNGSKDCVENRCICKKGYIGDYCQFCESSSLLHCLVIDNKITEGEIDDVSGEGVRCSCKQMKNLWKFVWLS